MSLSVIDCIQKHQDLKAQKTLFKELRHESKLIPSVLNPTKSFRIAEPKQTDQPVPGDARSTSILLITIKIEVLSCKQGKD